MYQEILEMPISDPQNISNDTDNSVVSNESILNVQERVIVFGEPLQSPPQQSVRYLRLALHETFNYIIFADSQQSFMLDVAIFDLRGHRADLVEELHADIEASVSLLQVRLLILLYYLQLGFEEIFESLGFVHPLENSHHLPDRSHLESLHIQLFS